MKLNSYSLTALCLLHTTVMAQVPMSINRHTSVTLSDGRADAILADAKALLEAVDGAGDVRCLVDFRRQGSVSTFSVGTGVINSSADFRAVCNTGGRVHMVNDINWCGGPGLNIIGCASTPGGCMVLVRFTESQEGILWAHEYGHNKGLNHRDADSVVMAPSIGSTHRRVNDPEKIAFEAEALAAAEGPPQPEPRAPSPAESLDGEQPFTAKPTDVREFVRKVYVHGVPYEAASQYTSNDLRILFQMLENVDEKSHWANIVATICMIGDAEATERLIAFLRKGEGKLTPEEYRAKKTVITGLGYIAQRAKDKNAVAFLIKGLDPASWVDQKIRWRNPFDEKSNSDKQLSTLAIWGLAVSGTPEAREALSGLKDSKALVQPLTLSIVDEALSLHSRVEKDGVKALQQRDR